MSILFFATLAPLPVGADEFLPQSVSGPVSIEAESMAYSGDDDVVQANGKVVITFTGGELKADAVTFYRRTGQALAVGDVHLRNGQDLLEGERVSFNIVSRTGTVEEGEMFIAREHFYIRGARIEKKAGENYRLEEGTVTTCDGDCPDWRLAGREVDVTVDGYGRLKGGRFLVGNVPIFYLPYLIFPVKTTRQTGFLFPRLAYSRDKNGLDVEVPFFWALSESADATFYQRYLEKRGLKEGVEYRFAAGEDSFGVLYGDFISDSRGVSDGTGALARDWQDSRNRWSYYLNHETTFADGFHLRSDIRRVSDHWYFKDFSNFNYYLDHDSPTGEDRFSRVPFLGDESLGSLDSTVRLTRDWPLYNLTALARYTDDFSSTDNRETLQRYPEATVTGFRRPLSGTPFQVEFIAEYDHFFRQEGPKGHLLAISPTLFLPLKLGPYGRITPQAGLRGDLWKRSDALADAGERYGDREIFSFGTTLSTELHRVFDLQGAQVEKIRHGIRPEITYTFVPDTSQDRVPDFLEPLPAQHSLAYAVTNTLLARIRAKDGRISYREWMRLKIGQTYDIREARRTVTAAEKENRPFGDIDLELDLAPVPYLSLSARNKFDVNAGNWSQNNYDLTLSDDRGDWASVGYRYTRDALEEINLSLKAVVTSALGMTYLLKRNQFDHRTVESAYGLQYRKQCWSIEVGLTDREEDRALTAVFSLYGIGN